MDAKSGLEAVAAIRSLVDEGVERKTFDAELAAQYAHIAYTAGPLAVAGAALAETDSPAFREVDKPGEQGEQDHTDLRERLLGTFEQAYQTYGFMVDVANANRNKRNKLPVVNEATVRADIEAICSSPAVLAELQAEIDYFTAKPETDSPAPGFRFGVKPEGLTDTDNQAIARAVQPKTKAGYTDPYMRPARYNDPRTPTATGKGYRVVLFPDHYNVPSDTANAQTAWTKAKNQTTAATELITATDGEALGHINNLLDQDKTLQGGDYDVSRFHKTYYRRYDQKPVGDGVSRAYVGDDGGLNLGESDVHRDGPARALVVPKLNA